MTPALFPWLGFALLYALVIGVVAVAVLAPGLIQRRRRQGR